jgi:hypothetical protein
MLVLIIRFTACHYHGRIDKGISKFNEKVKKYPAVTLSCYQPAVFNLTVDHQNMQNANMAVCQSLLHRYYS